MPTTTGHAARGPAAGAGIAADWSSDQRAFKNVSWGKAMMWIFLLSDTFIFSCFLLSYMTVRMSTTVPWPNPSEVFALNIGGTPVPLILIAIMTFVLISSSGTMAMAVNFGYRRDRSKTAALMLATAAFGATFVGMQAFEWTKLITEGVRPWGNPWGAAQFGSSFFMITGFPRHARDDRRDLPAHHRAQGLARRFRPRKRRASSPAARATTRSSRSWASTGTSSIWSGSSSSRFLSLVRKAWHMQRLKPRHGPGSACEGQQHPIRLYLVVWGWLFVLSTCSYLVDYFDLQGYLSWSLILLFMMLKAGLIVAVFMHMAWERLALIYAILLPPIAVLVFVGIMVFEADYTLFTRLAFFGLGS